MSVCIHTKITLDAHVLHGTPLTWFTSLFARVCGRPGHVPAQQFHFSPNHFLPHNQHVIQLPVINHHRISLFSIGHVEVPTLQKMSADAPGNTHFLLPQEIVTPRLWEKLHYRGTDFLVNATIKVFFYFSGKSCASDHHGSC